MSWTTVCDVEAIGLDEAVLALVDGEQVAVVRTAGGEVFAVDQRDPYSGAHVMARGIVGTRGDRPCLVSPMYKQVFDLRTGACLDTVGGEERVLPTWPVRVEAGRVLVGSGRNTGATPTSSPEPSPVGA